MSNKDQIEEKAFERRLTKYHVFVILFLIGVGGLLLRLSHLYADIPVTLDAALYFWYANDVALLDALPRDYTPANNGWPIFLSFFFQIMDSNNYLDYMVMQRLVSVALSVLTIVPVYVICRRFFSKKLALIGPVIFVFEPRIAENSLIGVTEPLFVLLIGVTVACFLSCRKRIVFFTFPVLALAAMVRGEAIVLIIPYTILYIVRFRHSRRTAYEIPLLIMLFMLILTPMITYRIDVTGTDAMFVRMYEVLSRFLPHDQGVGMDPATDVDATVQETLQLPRQADRLKVLIDLIRHNASLSSIPIIIFFVPYGLYRIFRHMEMKNVSVITILFFMAVPGAYALTSAFDPRYLFLAVPILCVFCIFSIRKFANFFPNKDLALVIIVAVIIASSVVISEDRRIDIEREREAIQIAKIVAEKTEKINLYTPEIGYLYGVGLSEQDEFPILRNAFEMKGNHPKYCATVEAATCDHIINLGGVAAEFLKNTGKEYITHFVADDVEHRRAQMLIHMFHNENEYPYLTKIYDSKNDGFSYHVKIFEIDYEKFYKMYPNDG